MHSALFFAGARDDGLCGSLRAVHAFWEDGHLAINILQANCESLTIDWLIYSYPDTAPGTYLVQVDGRYRRQKHWFGRSDSTWITDTWRGAHLEIVARKSPNDSSRVEWNVALGLTAKRNRVCLAARSCGKRPPCSARRWPPDWVR